MNELIKGLHHVTATVNDAQEDYNFYTKALGLRLVKETVNFDNERVYHFYYGNKKGTPSTIFTTFPYKGEGVKNGTIGTGQVFQTTFTIPPGSSSFWKDRLNTFSINYKAEKRFGGTLISFEDPSGLKLAFLEEEDTRGPIWSNNEISESHAIRGIESVTLLIEEAKATLDFLHVFGYITVNESGNLFELHVGKGLPGDRLFIVADSSFPKGKNGIGTVHHVAHRVDSLEDSLAIKAFIEEEFKLNVTEVKDRKYFQSIYFRIPGDVLFEVATTNPGFDVDEPVDELGSSLKLPDWQEPDRERIAKNLLTYEK